METTAESTGDHVDVGSRILCMHSSGEDALVVFAYRAVRAVEVDTHNGLERPTVEKERRQPV